jgi:hypothetical protein
MVTKTVADPCSAYEYMLLTWARSRAVCNGERAAKEFDAIIDTTHYRNLLIPFSGAMTTEQFNFYKAEAELPGIVAQFTKMLIGGLLRKSPTIELPASVPEEAKDWLLNNIGADNSTLVNFLDEALWEELQTSRAWVFVDHPVEVNEEEEGLKPYPYIQKAETIINWSVSKDKCGRSCLSRLIVKGYEEDYSVSEFHARMLATVWVHEIVDGYYQIRKFQSTPDDTTDQSVRQGDVAAKGKNVKTSSYVLVDTNQNILMQGERLTSIPAWPLNGSVTPIMPTIAPLVDKEVSLYNKLSRRNHLLYGAATYTPIISSDMTDEQFEELTESGLGTWIHLRQGDTADVLKTPTEALKDMQAAILSTMEEMAKLGVRMLSPENVQSGIALEIRNASQTAQLGVLATKVSDTLRQVFTLLINWRYDLHVDADEIKFKLSEDFDPAPLGADWLRLATEWYQAGLIPRDLWMLMLKQNDMIPPEYDDEEGKKQINEDELVIPKQAEMQLNQEHQMNMLNAKSQTGKDK